MIWKYVSRDAGNRTVLGAILVIGGVRWQSTGEWLTLHNDAISTMCRSLSYSAHNRRNIDMKKIALDNTKRRVKSVPKIMAIGSSVCSVF